MEFRRKASSFYAHFVFYPNTNFEDKAVKQCFYVREKLCALFAVENIDYLVGAHLFNCYKQCGYKHEEMRCICDVSPKLQDGRFPSGKCFILPEPRDASTLDNHLHILVRVPAVNITEQPFRVGSATNDVSSTVETPSSKPIKVEEAATPVGFSGNRGCSTSEVSLDRKIDHYDVALARETNMNWRLEGVVRQVQRFFSINMKKEQFGDFSVQQRNVWCPYSVWMSFVAAADDGFTTIVGNSFNCSMKKEWKKQSTDYANREMFPKRAPKMKARILWELHCVSMHDML